ncbi:MAG: phosphoenolpyruvate carboxykinase [Candidatus Marinimicrobia bacterium]|nr:phosphoenolpyruvate carboxykinase [Candidatus Neomarinimicrobiota bacterium]
MHSISYEITEDKVILKLKDRICESPEELVESEMFYSMLVNCIESLQARGSNLLDIFQGQEIDQENIKNLIQTFKYLTKLEVSLVPNVVDGAELFLEDKQTLFEFTEYFYNYWRSFDRFVICSSESDRLDERPYRTFNTTVEKLMHLVRRAYRNIQEHITGEHPQVYRQVHAGAEVATIAVESELVGLESDRYTKLNNIPTIRQILLYPPLIFDPPMNRRRGQFVKIDKNPFDYVDVKGEDWLCFPAKIGKIIVYTYFHKSFYELGFHLSNLFELAKKEDLNKKPDAVYLYGVDEGALDGLGDMPTVYHYDEDEDLLVAAVPRDKEFGYFGYLKKMMLTLHNTRVMMNGNMPFHGAFYKLTLKNNKSGNFLLIGDSGAGKSESIEAFRRLAEEQLKEMTIIADDMGSLEIDSNGEVIVYGTETGAFQRLDDYPPGFAFGQLDRAIISNPGKTNSRITLPVTTFKNVNKGTEIDFVLYANNYEEIDEDHPIIERFEKPEEALRVFREGAVMSKGTTDDKGLRHSYFANIFGPPQMKSLHDEIANKFFGKLFENDTYVGQIRTRLGVPGMEIEGPTAAAEQMLRMIQDTEL